MLHKTGETISHDEKDVISVFDLELINAELGYKKSPDEIDFIDV